MSKSYSKVKKFGICTGDNRDFYRAKRRSIRAKEKQVIRDILAHKDISEFDDIYTSLNIPMKDDWSEPTDGSFVLTAKDIDRDTVENGGYNGVYTTKHGKIKK